MYLYILKVNKNTGIYKTQQMPLHVLNWWIMDYETKIINAIPYISSTSDKMFNITLKCELDLTKFPLNFCIILFIL